MVTRNWYNAMTTRLFGVTIANGIVDYSGTKRDSFYYDSDTILGMYYFSPFRLIQNGVKTTQSSIGLVLGDGDTAPSLNDYKVSGNVLSSISASVTPNQEMDDTGATLTALITVTNTGESEITIREICLFGRVYYSSSTSGYCTCCLDRTVLDTPVTIPAGGVGQVEYTIRMPYPTT
jgi:hypothetical protein